jgi:uncharacterized protein with FMN-binding domain
MTKSGSGGRSKRVSNGLVALSSAAVLTVYTAGYLRTRPAAARFAVAAERRFAGPATATAAPPPAPTQPAVVIPEPGTGAAATISPTPKRVVTQPPRRSATTRRSTTSTAVAPAAPAPTPELPAAAVPVTDPSVTAAPVTDPSVTAAPPPAPPKTQYRDGTYLGWGSCRHGDIQASVVVEEGRIMSATIAQCLTRYSCSWIAALPPQVVSRQSPNVDYVSGATQSVNAFYDAVVDALNKAK